MKLGLVVATFDKDRPITREMESHARNAAEEAGVDAIETVEVPGSYDTPLAADRLARREEIDAVAVVGAIVTGDTDHDRVIADAAARGLTDVALERDTPVTFGVTGPGMSQAEAAERVEYGATAVQSAVEMVGALP